MLDEKYINFFEKIKLFKEEQKKQKQRGLNDYNMVNVVRKENSEVGMHSNVIYSLTDSNGLHYQDDLFMTMPIVNKNSGEISKVEIFVAVLGASDYPYVKALPSQQKKDFITNNNGVVYVE